MSINWLLQKVVAKRNTPFWRNELLISFSIYFIIMLISIFYSTNTTQAISSFEKNLFVLWIPVLLLTSQALDSRKVELLLKIFTASVMLATLICLGYAVHRNNYFEVFTNPNWFYFSYSDLTDVISIQPIYLSLYVSFSIFIVLLLGASSWHSTKGIVFKGLTIAFLCYLFSFLFLLSGRASIVATSLILIAAVFWFFLRMKRLYYGLMAATSIVIISGLLVYNLPIVKERFFDAFGLDKTSTWVYGDPQNSKKLPEARIIKWQSAFHIVKGNWLFGVGIGDVQDELNKEYEAVGFLSGVSERFNTHNQFLQTWVGTGLLGSIALLSTFFYNFRNAIRTRNYLFLSFLVLFILCSITESTLERQAGALMYTLFSCLFYSISSERTVKSSEELSR
ncbi:MAG: O-antigen ligase family protein [Bacteroidia bacterium]|nr:O-antigen ligase family protein [Bacteroidia bacterium]